MRHQYRQSSNPGRGYEHLKKLSATITNKPEQVSFRKTLKYHAKRCQKLLFFNKQQSHSRGF